MYAYVLSPYNTHIETCISEIKSWMNHNLCPPVCNLGLIIDPKLSFDAHVSSIAKISFFHLRNIAKLKHCLSPCAAESSYMLSSPPASTNVTPSSQASAPALFINFRRFKTQLPICSPSANHGIISHLFF